MNGTVSFLLEYFFVLSFSFFFVAMRRDQRIRTHGERKRNAEKRSGNAIRINCIWNRRWFASASVLPPQHGRCAIVARPHRRRRRWWHWTAKPFIAGIEVWMRYFNRGTRDSMPILWAIVDQDRRISMFGGREIIYFDHWRASGVREMLTKWPNDHQICIQPENRENAGVRSRTLALFLPAICRWDNDSKLCVCARASQIYYRFLLFAHFYLFVYALNCRQFTTYLHFCGPSVCLRPSLEHLFEIFIYFSRSVCLSVVLQMD